MIKLRESKEITVVGYHGDRKYLEENIVIKNDKYRTGLFFSSKVETAEVYGKYITKCELKFNRPFLVDAEEEYYSDIKTPKEMIDSGFTFIEKVDTDLIAKYAYGSGKYDGVIIKNVFEGNGNNHVSDVYNIFDSKNIISYENLEITSDRLYGRIQ